jgi:hypothetical protein
MTTKKAATKATAKKAAAKAPAKAPAKALPLETSAKVKVLAGKGLNAPSTLTNAEIRELSGSVLRHLEK